MNILYICNPDGIHDIKWVLFFSKRSDIRQFVIWDDIFDSEKTPAYHRFFNEHGVTVLPSYAQFSLRRAFSTRKTVRKFNELIEKHLIDIVHILFTTPHSLYAPFFKAPVILTTRGSDILKVLPGLKTTTGIKGLHDKALFYIFKQAFEKAAFITTTSQKQLEWVKHLFNVGDRCRLVRTGIDVESIDKLDAKEYLPVELEDKKFIFSPRWMFPQYNLETQIEAIKLLDKSILEEYTFVFIHGNDIFMLPDDYFVKMREEIRKVKGLKFIIFERLTQKEVWACFKQASLTIMVPHTDGTPNSALEAMASRCKLIMGDADYDQILFDNTCIRVTRTDAAQLARAIETTLVTYPEGLLEEAFQKVSQHGNRAIEMNKVLALYQTLMVDRTT